MGKIISALLDSGALGNFIVGVIIVIPLAYKFFDAMRLSKLEELYIGKQVKKFREIGTYVFFTLIFLFLNVVLGFKPNQNDAGLVAYSSAMVLLTIVLFVFASIPTKCLEKLYDLIKRKDKDEIVVTKYTLLTCMFSTLASIPSAYIVDNFYDEYLRNLDSSKKPTIIDAIMHGDWSFFLIFIVCVAAFQALIMILLLSQITKKTPDVQIIRHTLGTDGVEKTETQYIYHRVGNHIICGEDEDYRKCENRFLDFEKEIQTATFKYIDKSTNQVTEETDVAGTVIEETTKDMIVISNTDKPIKLEVTIVNNSTGAESQDTSDAETNAKENDE